MIPNLLGNIPDRKKIYLIAKKYKLKVIEDSADTIGYLVNGKVNGGYSDETTNSFYASHIINGAGFGGIACFNDYKLYQEAKLIRGWGRSSAIFNESEKIQDRFNIKISGIDGIALTKLDVLDELDEIKMCVEYELDGKKIDYLPAAVEDQLKIKPVYRTFPGWKTSTNGIKNMDALPENAKNYIYAVEDFIGAKVSSVSTSPERDDTILVENPFDI